MTDQVQPFARLRSKPYVFERVNTDTDQIIPARFLKATTREGFGAALFADLRSGPEGFDPAAAAGRSILLAGENFGCGSSREHAPWALMQFGFRAVLAPSFADIFAANALKCGLLPLAITPAAAAAIRGAPEADVMVDLEASTITHAGGVSAFAIDPFARRRLLDGVDELGFLLARLPQIEAFEHARS